jgi:hypothetical protein
LEKVIRNLDWITLQMTQPHTQIWEVLGRDDSVESSWHVRAVDSASAGCSKTISREIVGKKAQCAREAMKLHRRRAMYVAAISEDARCRVAKK